jgi:hypothetical protein
VIEFFEHLCLCDKPLAYDFIVVAAVLAYFLDRPGFIGTLVEGKVHDTHTAMTDLIQDFVFSIQYGSYLQHCYVFLSNSIGLDQDGTGIVILVSLNIEPDQISDPAAHDLF